MAAISQTSFKFIFLNGKFCILIQISLKFVPNGLIDNVNIGSGKGLTPIRWQAITWTNDESVHWRKYAAQGRDELTHWTQDKIVNIM